MIGRPVARVADLTDPSRNRLHGLTVEEARRRVASGDPSAVLAIDGSYALVAAEPAGPAVRMARSLDRPLRYFLAKQSDGPLLVAADRIDAIASYLEARGCGGQFHPSYTRMVPAHHVLEIRLVGCPDPLPTLTRFFDPPRGTLPADRDAIGRAYVSALAEEIRKWATALPPDAPIGVAFSGGVDSGAVLLVAEHVLRSLGSSPARLKAFTLSRAGRGGADLDQARAFLRAVGRELYLEPIEAAAGDLDFAQAVAVVEDYKPLDVESAAMALALCRGIRRRYPDWRFLLDGDGGDENLKDYPIDANAELTIRSVLSNAMLYQEGWGVASVKHSLTYSGGQSRSCTRTYAPLARHGFEGFSPYTRPAVVAVAEAIPFVALTEWSHDRLYELKGEIVARGVAAVTGVAMPVNPKRRFQHGVVPEEELRRAAGDEAAYRAALLSRYAAPPAAAAPGAPGVRALP